MKPLITTITNAPGIAEFQKVFSRLPDLNIFSGPWLAGGATRRMVCGEDLSEADLDIFFYDHEQYTDFKHALEKLGAEPSFSTQSAVTFKYTTEQVIYKIQLIRRKFYKNVQSLIEDFDFSICQLATDGEWLITSNEAPEDLINKRLRLSTTGKSNPDNLIRRVAKYTNYGYEVSPDDLLKLVQENIGRISEYTVKNVKPQYDWDDEDPSSVTLNKIRRKLIESSIDMKRGFDLWKI